MDVENFAPPGFEMEEVHRRNAHCYPSTVPLISDEFEPNWQRFSTSAVSSKCEVSEKSLPKKLRYSRKYIAL